MLKFIFDFKRTFGKLKLFESILNFKNVLILKFSKEIRLDGKDRRLLQNLYLKQES